jgi:hypothetical protein
MLVRRSSMARTYTRTRKRRNSRQSTAARGSDARESKTTGA